MVKRKGTKAKISLEFYFVREFGFKIVFQKLRSATIPKVISSGPHDRLCFGPYFVISMTNNTILIIILGFIIIQRFYQLNVQNLVNTGQQY